MIMYRAYKKQMGCGASNTASSAGNVKRQETDPAKRNGVGTVDPAPPPTIPKVPPLPPIAKNAQMPGSSKELTP